MTLNFPAGETTLFSAKNILTEIRTCLSTDYLFSLLFFHATSPAVASKNIRP